MAFGSFATWRRIISQKFQLLNTAETIAIEAPEQTPNEFHQQPGEPASRQAPKRSKKNSWNLKKIGSNGVLLLFGGIVLVFVYAFVQRTLLNPPAEPEIRMGNKMRVIQLDVLNGSGVPKLGQRFTEYLRARGFDVVEMGNYKESNVEYTRVLDRSGNLQAAQQVAEALGVPQERVRQAIDKTTYLDVTVIIGKDHRSLKQAQ